MLASGERFIRMSHASVVDMKKNSRPGGQAWHAVCMTVYGEGETTGGRVGVRPIAAVHNAVVRG